MPQRRYVIDLLYESGAGKECLRSSELKNSSGRIVADHQNVDPSQGKAAMLFPGKIRSHVISRLSLKQTRDPSIVPEAHSLYREKQTATGETYQ
jgi:hypothetical protein